MVLIADSGASNTAWRMLYESGEVGQAVTDGFNPYLQNADEMTRALQDNLLPQLTNVSVKEVHFYGAGCSSEDNIRKVSTAINNVFPSATIAVSHDLLAAARALCGQEPGIACIMGTGVNSCLYDGNDVVQNVPGLGFALADEGSGAYLGKRLLVDYLRKDVPENIANRLEKRFEVDKDTVLYHVYQGQSPSKYLAGFSKFIFQNLKEPYLYRLVFESFSAFVEKNILKYDNYKELKVHFTGSIAFYYSNILRQAAADKGVTVRNILESPIAGLTLFHQQKMKG